ncbi:unnamed protein product [Ectocarpus sp. 6 AP-2014]
MKKIKGKMDGWKMTTCLLEDDGLSRYLRGVHAICFAYVHLQTDGVGGGGVMDDARGDLRRCCHVCCRVPRFCGKVFYCLAKAVWFAWNTRACAGADGECPLLLPQTSCSAPVCVLKTLGTSRRTRTGEWVRMLSVLLRTMLVWDT